MGLFHLISDVNKKMYDIRLSIRNIREISRNGQGIEACY